MSNEHVSVDAICVNAKVDTADNLVVVDLPKIEAALKLKLVPIAIRIVDVEQYNKTHIITGQKKPDGLRGHWQIFFSDKGQAIKVHGRSSVKHAKALSEEFVKVMLDKKTTQSKLIHKSLFRSKESVAFLNLLTLAYRYVAAANFIKK